MKYAVFTGFMFDKSTVAETEQGAMAKFLEKYGHLGPEPKEADLDIRPVHPIDHLKHTLWKYRMPEDKIERASARILEIFQDDFIPAMTDALGLGDED